MQKKVLWIAQVIAMTILLLAVIVLALKVMNGNYSIEFEAYIAFVSLWISAAAAFLRAFTNKCPHCGKVILSSGEYCSHCGKKIAEKS